MVPLPRVVIAAPASGQGKTTVSFGLMAALAAGGLGVAPFKIGPDYIDPGYHALATGRPGRNLDPHLCGPELMVPLLRHGFETPTMADVAVVEGVMGLFDGRLGADGFGSTAHVAGLISAPVVLVIDAGHASRTLAAVAHGLATFDPAIDVAGVIVNRAHPSIVSEVAAALASVGLPLLGAIPPSTELAVPSRHLGLVPAAERDEARDVVAAAARVVEAHVDVAAILDLARAAGPVVDAAWDPRDHVPPVPGAPTIAIAGGRAFTFRYPETTELLTAAGCRIVEIDPLGTAGLPADVAGLYLGGGFPEVYAERLAANAALRADVAAAVAAGLPTVAECAGLLYLCASLDGLPMAGALPLAARMAPRLTLGYHEVAAARDSVIARAGERFRAHEFHRTRLDGDLDGQAAWRIGDRLEGVATDPAGIGKPTLLASYQHLHWAGYPACAQRFAAAAADHAARPRAWQPAEAVLAPAVDEPAGLDHHGDRDLGEGLVDLAVNVRAARPPAWLADRLAAGAARWAAYPDATPAVAAIAAAHALPAAMVLPTAGGAEAFTLIARGLAPRRAVVVHPQFTEPEAALRAAGRPVARALLSAESGFRLDPAAIDDDADLVVVGNPTNPTSVLHPRAAIAALRRPSRVIVVDEAFMDAVPGEPESLIDPAMAGVLVVRSLTKTWSIAGIRAGYVVGDPALIERLAAQQPPWSVSTPAIDATVACLDERARAEAEAERAAMSTDRATLVAALADAGFACVPEPRGPFVLVDTSPAGPRSVRGALARAGFAVRRGESFPGLSPSWIRLAVRDPQTSRAVADTLATLRLLPERTPS